jgi:hypothetical protein
MEKKSCRVCGKTWILERFKDHKCVPTTRSDKTRKTGPAKAKPKYDVSSKLKVHGRLRKKKRKKNALKRSDPWFVQGGLPSLGKRQ